jgi:hypothetical protein
MDVIFSAIVGWFTSKILDRVFFRKKSNNEEIIGIYERRLAEKDELIQKLEKAQKKRKKEKRRIIQSLKRSGLSTDKLVERYDKPLNAILISYSHQTPKAFIKDELARYNSKWLGGDVSLIPPTNVPKNIKNKDDLKSWFEKEILKGRNCKLKFLTLIDLKAKAYWYTYLPNAQIERIHGSIGERLNIEDLFTEEQINRIALSNIIRDGDIVWLASGLLSGTELEIIHSNQTLIENKLGKPSLSEFADDNIVSELSVALADIGISNPDEVSKAIVDEAKFWHSRLK